MKRKIILVAVFAVVGALPVGAYSWFHRGDTPLTASGTLEARNINVGSKEGGRVAKVLANEGDRLEANQLLVTFDDVELAARVLQARGKLEQAQANLAKMLHGSRPEEIEEAQAAGCPASRMDTAQKRLRRARPNWPEPRRTYRTRKSISIVQSNWLTRAFTPANPLMTRQPGSIWPRRRSRAYSMQ